MASVNISQILKSLPQIKILDIWPDRPITWVTTQTNLQDVLQILKQKRILSVPVFDVSSNSCVGIVDILNLAIFIVLSFPNLNVITHEVLQSLMYNGKKFLEETTVDRIIAFTKSYNLLPDLPSFAVKVETPILQLMDSFSQGIHRVPVVSDDGKILNFISQSDLVRYFAENLYLLTENDLGRKSLEELGLGRRGVYFVRSDVLTLHTLAALSLKRVSALAILDKDTGKLAGNFSASDLRGLGPMDLPHLLRPLVDFLRVFNTKSLFPITCKRTDTLEHALMKLVATRVHRLWVVDDDRNLVGIVTLTDMITAFLGIQAMDVSPETVTPLPFQIYPSGTEQSSPEVKRIPIL